MTAWGKKMMRTTEKEGNKRNQIREENSKFVRKVREKRKDKKGEERKRKRGEKGEKRRKNGRKVSKKRDNKFHLRHTLEIY